MQFYHQLAGASENSVLAQIQVLRTNSLRRMPDIRAKKIWQRVATQ